MIHGLLFETVCTLSLLHLSIQGVPGHPIECSRQGPLACRCMIPIEYDIGGIGENLRRCGGRAGGVFRKYGIRRARVSWCGVCGGLEAVFPRSSDPGGIWVLPKRAF